MFLTADWQLSSKQKVCDWRQNRLFSVTVLATATWAAATAQPWTNWLGHDAAPDGFTKRFGANLTQNAFKSTAGYLAGMIEQEDPRERPPFLILQETASPPRGVWRRIGAAVRANFVSYRCDNRCTDPGDVKKVAALSRMAGAVASGLSSELWNSGEPDRHTRAARGIASAYVATFVNSLSVEFKPELSAAADHVLTFIFGGR
jgi:hypothetical protein